MLEVREGSDFPRFRERIRTRLDMSDGGWPADCCRLAGSRRYFPAEQQHEVKYNADKHLRATAFTQLYLRDTEKKQLSSLMFQMTSFKDVISPRFDVN